MSRRGRKPPGNRSLWRNAPFLLLWGGQSVSILGSTVSGIVIPLYAVAVLHASVLAMGLLAAAAAIPYALIGLPAGAIVDRLRRRRLMLGCDCARAAALASLPAALPFGGPSMAQLVVVALAIGALTVFFDVAYQSYLPSLVETEQLIDGNGKLATTESLAESVGPGLAGLLITVMGRIGAIFFDASSYLLSALSLALIRTPDEQPQKELTFSVRTFPREIAEGISYIAHEPVLRRIAAFAVTANLFGAAYNALEIVFLYRDLHASAAMIGAASAIGSAAGVLAGLAAAPLSERIGSARAIWLPLLALGWLALLAPLAQPGWGFVLVGVATGGNVASIVIFATGSVSYRQIVCPPALLNKVTATQRWLSWCTLPAGSLLGGAVGTAVGLRGGIAIAVAGCFASGLWLFFSPLRRMRDLPDSGPDGDDAAEPTAREETAHA